MRARPPPVDRRFVAFAVSVTASLACARCDDERPRRTPTHEPIAYADDAQTTGFPDGGLYQIPRDPNPAVVEDPPEDIGSCECPGVRVIRVRRRFVAAPPNAPPLTPRYYGRDDHGRIWDYSRVLLCELYARNWLNSAAMEASLLILWKGPFIFEPDSDCDWREPIRLEPPQLDRRLPNGGRRIYAHEHCRRRARPGPLDRTVMIEVGADYSYITAQ